MATCDEIDAQNLLEKAKIFYKKNGLLLNWKEFGKLDHSQMINTMAMISPITNEENKNYLKRHLWKVK